MTEWTESRNWTESTEAREAKRSEVPGEFLVSAQHGWPGVAAVLTEQMNSDGLALLHVGSPLSPLIVICRCPDCEQYCYWISEGGRSYAFTYEGASEPATRTRFR